MVIPVNFDSVDLDTVLSEWLGNSRDFAVQAVAVLGPDPFGGPDDRQLVAVHPPACAAAGHALAASSDFGAPWRESAAPLVAWQSLSRPEDPGGKPWRAMWAQRGFHSVVRVEFPLPADRAFECFMFTQRELVGRDEAAVLVWSALNVWPLVRRAIGVRRSSLSPRERECLQLAFQGLTARESAGLLQCAERTVNYHLANAMAKLKVDNKLAAIQRACWLGAI
jgi:LuxR family transcriptional regulator, quorum-sensing system regulator SolR